MPPLLIAVERLGQAEEQVMQHILGIFERPGDPVRQPHDRPGVPLVQGGQSIRFPVTGALDERGFTRLGAHAHVS